MKNKLIYAVFAAIFPLIGCTQSGGSGSSPELVEGTVGISIPAEVKADTDGETPVRYIMQAWTVGENGTSGELAFEYVWTGTVGEGVNEPVRMIPGVYDILFWADRDADGRGNVYNAEDLNNVRVVGLPSGGSGMGKDSYVSGNERDAFCGVLTNYNFTAGAAIMLLSSCQRDELQNGMLPGEEVSVSISGVVSSGAGAQVKSAEDPGDGTLVNRCIMQIYYLPDGESGTAEPIPYGDRVTVAVSGMKAVFPDQRLVSGHDYRFVFWADCVDDGSSEEGRATDLHYDTGQFPVVSFKSGDVYKGNDDTRDAFFGTEVMTISGPSSLSFDLKRPFGQLNIITTD